jgi:hypothetical protein
MRPKRGHYFSSFESELHLICFTSTVSLNPVFLHMGQEGPLFFLHLRVSSISVVSLITHCKYLTVNPVLLNMGHHGAQQFLNSGDKNVRYVQYVLLYVLPGVCIAGFILVLHIVEIRGLSTLNI